MTWKTARKLIVAVGGIVVSGAVWYGVNHYYQEKYRRLTVGRETTYVTGPLLADGRVDFLSAVNGKLAEGATLENNAAVPLFLSMGDFDMAWRMEAYRKALGINEMPKAGEAYVDFGKFKFERMVATATNPQEVRNHEGELTSDFNDEVKAMGKRPWKREENADMFAWLEMNKRILELTREAGRREKCFLPLVARADLGSTMFAFNGPLGGIRQHVDLMSVDAMLAAGSGDFARWHEDVLTEKRLGRHLMHSGTVMGCLVGVSVTWQADDAIIGGLKAAPAQEARGLLADLRALPPMADINDCVDQYERLEVIGEICQMSYFGPNAGEVNRSDPTVELPKPASFGFQAPIQFDELLREYNLLVDRRVAAGRTTPYSARKTALAAHKADCMATTAKLTGRSSTDAIRRMIYLAADAPSSSSVIQDKTVEKARLTELTLLLVIHRGEHGGYPKTLAELGDVGEAGKDVFSDDGPVRYVAETGLIYSVGPNQRDDKGVNDPPVGKRTLNAILPGMPTVVGDSPDDIAVKLP